MPPEKLLEVVEFDGSFIFYRTAGRVSFACDNEAANFLGVNLMHDIVTGKRTPAEARQEYADQLAAWTMNRPAPYTEGIQFEQPAGQTTASSTRR